MAGASESATLVQVNREDTVATVTLNRPDRHNALSSSMTEALVRVFEELRDDDSVHCVVLAGNGPSFCSGRDVDELRTMLVEGIDLPLTPIPAGRMSLLVRSLPQLVISRVHGMALGEGMDLALACDVTIAAQDATFGDPHLQHGVVPGAGMWRLPRLVGTKRAADMLYLGRKVSGTTASEWGLINDAVPEAELDEAVGDVVARVVKLPAFSLRATKEASRLAEDRPLADVLDAIARSRAAAAYRGLAGAE